MSSSVHSYSTSDENSSVDERPCLKGVLSKWTNYYNGWQERYVRCEDGSLQYFRSQDEVGFGCRGSMSLAKAVVTSHEFDPCRFDVTIKDSTWYLRSSSAAERQQWIDVIEGNMLDRDSFSMQSDDSSLLLPPTSQNSEAEFKSKLTELKTLRNILTNQIDVLQRYFEACLAFSSKTGFEKWIKTDEAAGTPVDVDRISFFDEGSENSLELNKVDLRRESLSFKVTTSGIETALNSFLSLVNEREAMWKRKCDELEKKLQMASSSPKNLENRFSAEITPDHKTAPSNASRVTLNDDVKMTSSDDDSDDEFYDPNNNFDFDSLPNKISHRFANEVEEKIKEHLEDSFRIPEIDDKWALIAEDHEMRLFSSEVMRDGVVCDPMKAVLRTSGVSSRELCHFFWETSSRREWDHTIEELNVLETIDDATVIIHQVHKVVWPVTQRDCLYISTMLKVENPPKKDNGLEPLDTWMVCNFSVDHDKATVADGRVRAIVEVALVCQTFATKPIESDAPIPRDSLSCDIVYIANVNPGGWAPAPILRAIGKREYPKFLKNFSNFVAQKMKDNDVLF